MASPPAAFRRIPAFSGGNLPAISRAPIASAGGRLAALGYRAPRVVGGDGGVTIYPLAPFGVGFGEGGATLPIGATLPGITIGGSAARLIPGRRPAPIISRAQELFAPQPLPTRGPGAPPQNLALPGGYRVITPPAAVGTLPARPSGVGVRVAAPSIMPPTPRLLPAPPISGVAPAPIPETAPGGGYLPQRGLLMQAIQLLGLVEAGRALRALVLGQSLSGSEFGALAGAILGAFVEDPAAGAKIGASIGAVMDALNALSVGQTGQTIDHWLSTGARDLWATLRAQPTVQPPQPPIVGQPVQPPQGPPLQGQPEQPPGYPPPMPPARQPPFYPPSQPPPPSFMPPGRQPPFYPPPAERIPPMPPQQGGPPPCPTCAPVQEGDCPPEVQHLVEQISNCPPTMLQKLFDRLQIRQKPGQRPVIEVREPVCLCCDSSQDLEDWTSSGGVRGSCVQVVGAEVGDIQRR